MLLAAKFILGASLVRTESRLSHFREDHEQRDDANWLDWIDIAETGDGGRQDGPRYFRTKIPTPLCPVEAVKRPTRKTAHAPVAGV